MPAAVVSFIGSKLVAIGSVLGAGSAGALTAMAVGAAAVVAGAVAAQKLISELYSVPNIDSDRSRQATVRGTVEPQKLIYGEALVSGPISFVGVAGTDNRDLYHAIVLAGHPSDSISDIYFDDERIQSAHINASGNVTTGTFGPKDGTTICVIRKLTGSQTTADSVLDGAFFTINSSEHIGTNLTYIVTKFTLTDKSQETWDKFMPNDIKALVKGKKVYDPRQDSTSSYYDANVGVGTQRSNDSTTWEWSENPVWCLVDYLTDNRFGMGIGLDRIDLSKAVDAADICDATVSVPGGSEKRYTCNGVVFGTSTHKTNINKLLSSMNGMLTYTNGKYVIRAGAFEAVGTGMTLTEDHMTGPVKLKTSFERNERFNTITGTFIDPSKNYKEIEFPKVQIASALTRDNNEELTQELKLSMTNSRYMAQRIAHKLIQLSDLQKVLTFPTNLAGVNISVGDRVNVTLSEFGYTNKTFVCLGWTLSESGTGGVNLTLREDDSSSYADLAQSGYSTVTPAGGIQQGFFGVPDPSGLSATAHVESIELDWTNPANMTGIIAIEVFASPNSSWSSAVKIGETLGTQFIHDESNGVDAIVEGDQRYYWVRARRFPSGEGSDAVSDRNPDSDTSTIQATKGALGNLANLDTVGEAQIDDNAVGNDQIADDAVDTDQIADGAIGGTTITDTKIYHGAGTFESSDTAFYLDDSGRFSLKEKLSFDGTTLNVDGDIKANILNVQEASISGVLTAGALADGSVKTESISQEVWNQIESRLGTTSASTGFFAEAQGNITGGDLTLTSGATALTHAAGQTVYFEADLIYSWSSGTSVSGDDLKIDVKFQHDTNSSFSSPTTVYTEQITVTRSSYFIGFLYDISDSVQYELTGLAAGDYYFRVSLEPVGATPNAFSIAYLGVPATFQVNEIGTGSISTSGNADTLDSLDSTQFLRSDTDDTFDGNLTITGDLILQGGIDQYNVTNLTVDDKTITVNSGNTQALSDGAGLIVDRGTADDASITWDENANRFEFTHDIKLPAFGQIIVSGNDYLDFDDDSQSYGTGTNATVLASISDLVLRTNTNDGGGGLFRVSTGGSSPTSLLDITTAGAATFSGSISAGAITSSASVIASGNSNSFGNTTISALTVTSVTASGSITASGNSNSFGTITTSGTLDFTANPAYIRNDQDNLGQIIISAKNSSGSAQQVRWDAANASTGAWRPEVTGVSNLGLTNRVWGTLYVNNIRMGSGNNLLVDANRNITAGTISSGAITSSGTGQFTFMGLGVAPNSSNYLLINRVTGNPNIKSSDAYLLMDSNGGMAGLNWYSSDRVVLANGGGNVSIGSSGNSTQKLYIAGDVRASSTIRSDGGFLISGTTVIDSSRNLTNILGLYGNGGTLNHYNTNHVFKSTTSNLQAQITDTGIGVGVSPQAVGAGNTTAGLSLYSDGRIFASKSGNTVMSLNRNTSDGVIAEFRKDGSTVGSIGTINSLLTIGTGDTGIIFNSSSNAVYPWNVSTNGGSDGQIDLGIGTRRWRDLHLSGDLIINGTTRINSAGVATLGTTTTGALTAGAITATSLSLSGAFTPTSIAATSTVSGSQFRASYGSESAPAFTFKNDDDTGMYGSAARIHFAVSGDEKIQVQPSSIILYESTTIQNELKVGTIPQIVITSARALQNISTGAFSGKLTINNANYANHLELVRGSDTLYLTPSGGQLITNGGLSADVTNTDDLGRTDKYWANLWLGTALKMGGTTVLNSSRKLVNSTGATIAHSEHQGVKITGTDSNANTSFTSMVIDHNASGSTALTADRSHIALSIDMDSSATGGNTTDEHRLYGIHSSVKATGDSDLIYGIYSVGEAEQTAGQISGLYGLFAQATTDAVAGTVSSSYGVYGYNSLTASSGTTINNAYALYGKSLVSASQDANISSVHGVYAEVEIDPSGAGTTVSTVYGVRSEIDNDAGTADTTITNGYLFYGNYAGDLPSTAYGVYIADTVPNRFNGSIQAGDGSTSTASYGFNGDVNTGMYSPANHELGFLQNGTQRLKIDANGVTVPTNRITFHTSNVNPPTSTNATTGARLNLYPSGSGRDYTIGIESSHMWFNTDGGFKWYEDGAIRMHMESGGHLNLSTGSLKISSTTVIDGSRNITSRSIVAVGNGTTSSTTAFTAQNSSGTTIFRARDDGRVLIPSGYLYAQSSEGIYSTGSIKARGGITNDGGNNLSISSGGSAITFNSKNFTSVGTISSGAITSTGTITTTGGNIGLRRNTGSDGATLRDIEFLNSSAEGTDDRVAIIRANNQGGTSTTRGGKLTLYSRKANNAGFNSINLDQLGVLNTGQITASGSVTAGDASSALGFYVGSTQVISGTRNLVNIGTISSGAITSSGNITAYSDERLKSDIKTLDGSKVYNMRGVAFKKNGEAGSGVIAQELQQVAPELVEDGEYKSVAYGNLVGYLIEAVKGQKAIIDDLTKRIEELENGDN